MNGCDSSIALPEEPEDDCPNIKHLGL